MTFRFLKELKGLYSDPSLCPVQRFPYFCFLYRILIFCVLCFWSKQRIVFFTAIHPWFASMLLTWSWLVIVTANLRRYGSVEKYIHTPSRFVLRKLEWVQDEWATWLEHRLNLVIFFSLPFWIFFKHFGVADLNSWTNICCFFKIYFFSFAFSEKAFLEMLSAGSLRIQWKVMAPCRGWKLLRSVKINYLCTMYFMRNFLFFNTLTPKSD